jgi:predicted metal-binding protein
LACAALFQRLFGALDLTLNLWVTLVLVLCTEVNSRYREWKKESDNEKLVEKIKAEVQKETHQHRAKVSMDRSL